MAAARLVDDSRLRLVNDAAPNHRYEFEFISLNAGRAEEWCDANPSR